MNECPECGAIYAYHDEFRYGCPNGHSWKPAHA